MQNGSFLATGSETPLAAESNAPNGSSACSPLATPIALTAVQSRFDGVPGEFRSLTFRSEIPAFVGKKLG
uniref:Uncharacterized protein n=1 Tax=Bursaphelenchus xylophilus TaxID=6326 RepID=A0A1I7SPR1_BURXY